MIKSEFFYQLTACTEAYDNDNQWFGFQRGGPPWSQGTWEQFILAAWKLYENVSASQLQLILLGDTKIRSDPQLLFNFGLSANTRTPQEDKDKALVSELMYKRRKWAGGTKGKEAAENIMGPGSILSAKRWSPALNDAFVLGAIHKKQSFHFALNDQEQVVWRNLTTMPNTQMNADFANRLEKFGGATRTARKNMDMKAIWLEFMREVPRVLWENGNPRVFARELLGLQMFGYRPVFTEQELGFVYRGKKQEPTFENYLKGLRDVNFHQRDRVAVIQSISNYLFDDANLLNGVGA